MAECARGSLATDVRRLACARMAMEPVSKFQWGGACRVGHAALSTTLRQHVAPQRRGGRAARSARRVTPRPSRRGYEGIQRWTELR